MSFPSRVPGIRQGEHIGARRTPQAILNPVRHTRPETQQRRRNADAQTSS